MRPINRLGLAALTLVLVGSLAPGHVTAQQSTQDGPPPVNQSDHPLLKDFAWRPIGPASMSGRIDDIEAVEGNPSIIYLGFATGGLWKSTNMGTTFTPLFDEYPVSSVGDIAIAPSDPDVIWVGTGESNNRQSTTSGWGVYRSTDGGETFAHVGLENTYHISRVVVDPNDPDVAYVAAMGHLFGPNAERGLFKTTDGGATWTNTNFIDENTGFTEVVMDPRNSRVLYAASYQRQRTPWGFNGGGPGSGIWKTTNGGETWTRLTGSGLPEGEFGRIGLAVFRANPDIVYAQIEVPNPVRRRGEEAEVVDPRWSGVWKSTDGGETWEIQSNNNNRPMYYSQIRVDPTDSDIVYTMGAPFYKSVDGGKTFNPLSGFGHGDHHALWINPENTDHLILGTDGGFNISWDQGETWDYINNMAVGQFYAIGVDMRRPYFVCGGLQDNGSWCGPSATRTGGGIANFDWYRIGGGDGFYTQIDPTDYNTVYVESQGGNMSRLDLTTGDRSRIRPTATQPPSDERPEPIPGNVIPEPEVGERYRFNWNTPIAISPHDPNTIYTGGNRFFKSTDRGTTWTASEDLTKAIDRNGLSIMGIMGDQFMASKNDGQSNYGNITTVAESPSHPGVIWVGTDDGNVQVSRDGGDTWVNLTARIPGPSENAKVSRVEPSHFAPGTCYVTLDNHMNDDLAPYVFVTRDYGQTWESISAGLPRGNVNVIKEDLNNLSLLFLGTEFGLFISLDGGLEWHPFMTGLPTVRVDDIVVHPRENDLVVGTHGRSILIIDDITPLQQLNPAVMRSDFHLFEVRDFVRWASDVQLSRNNGGSKRFSAPNPPSGTAIHYYLPAGGDGEVEISITDRAGNAVRSLTGPANRGINRIQWDGRHEPPPPPEGAQRNFRREGPFVDPGVYVVTASFLGREMVRTVVVEEDVWMRESH